MLVNANETSWIGYRDPAASDPLPQVFVMDARVISVVASFQVGTVPLEQLIDS